jgi:hypothetical protein
MMLKITPDIEPIEMRDPQAYDHVIFLSPLWNMNITPHMLLQMSRVKDKLGPDSFVTFCGHHRPGQDKHVIQPLNEQIGRPPEHLREICVCQLLENKQNNIFAVSGHKLKEEEVPIFHEAIDEVVGWFQVDK